MVKSSGRDYLLREKDSQLEIERLKKENEQLREKNRQFLEREKAYDATIAELNGKVLVLKGQLAQAEQRAAVQSASVSYPNHMPGQLL